MGMFDEIIVPRSYLVGILDKKDKKLFDTQHKFQTKDLDTILGGGLDLYKLYRGRLSKRCRPGKWEKTTVTGDINLYDSFLTKDGDECWFEFEFKFINGKIDSKKLVDKTVTNKESREAIDVMWNIEQEIFDEYRKKWSYKFWIRVERFCQKITVMARNRHLIPYHIRKQAYKTSGRSADNPDCLKWYQDI
jgi:hypothetical protein